jgi:glycine/D-amino acid oxidase-like deaminating enzyme
MLEGRCISGGATGHNGGFLSPGTTNNIYDIIRTHGIVDATAEFNYTLRCTQAIEEFVIKHNIDCELRFHGKASLATTEEQLQRLRRTYENLLRVGCDDQIEWWDYDAAVKHTNSTQYVAGIFHKYSGNLWPSKLVNGIAKEAELLGANIQSHTMVESIEYIDSSSDNSLQSQNHHFVVNTNRGSIKTSHVVHATNAYASTLLPQLKDIIIPVRNQVIITSPLPKIWDFSISANEGYEYMMQRPDGRIVLGITATNIYYISC